MALYTSLLSDHTWTSFIDNSGGKSTGHKVGLLWAFSGGIARLLHCECWDNKEGSLLEQSGSIYAPLSLSPTSCVAVKKPWSFPVLMPPSVNVGNFGVGEDEGDIVWEPLTGSGHPWRLPGCCWRHQVGDILCREECYCKPASTNWWYWDPSSDHCCPFPAGWDPTQGLEHARQAF